MSDDWGNKMFDQLMKRVKENNKRLYKTADNPLDVIDRLYKDLEIAKSLLAAAQCPQCGDKSGAYYDNQGEVCQCQWCYEVGRLNEN